MRTNSSQVGVGLIEVMVALLLLSIAMLGFSMLQVRAVSATDESLVRTKSLTLIRNLSEIMRAYPNAYVTGTATSFTTAAPTATSAVSTVQAVMSSSATTTVTVDNKVIDMTTSANGCLSTQTDTVGDKIVPKQNCNMSQLAARDALMFKKIAKEEEIDMTVVTCPGTTTQAIQTQMCVIAAWNETKAMLSTSDSAACANENGVYKSGSHCLISEAY